MPADRRDSAETFLNGHRALEKKKKTKIIARVSFKAVTSIS